jgi:hypothetical protein
VNVGEVLGIFESFSGFGSEYNGNSGHGEQITGASDFSQQLPVGYSAS